MAEFASFSRTSLNTLVLNGRCTAENIARNLGRYVAGPSLSRLRDAHKGRPAIVVSAVTGMLIVVDVAPAANVAVPDAAV